jgi:hypothetical protein
MSKEDVWAKLVQMYFDTHTFGSDAVQTAFRVGRLNEDAVAKHLPRHVANHCGGVKIMASFDVGLLVNRTHPWLAASPDQVAVLELPCEGGTCQRVLAGVEIKTATTRNQQAIARQKAKKFGSFVRYGTV